MSTVARISIEQYDQMVNAGVFDGRHHQRVELIHGELRERSSSTVAHISMEQYDLMIAAGVFDGPHQKRIELIHGELREMNPIGPGHEISVDWLNEWSIRELPLKTVWVRVQNSIGLVELDSAPQPDLAWVARRNYAKHRPVGADILLVIEVALSSLIYDRGEKAELYARAGVADYWVVNLVQECVEVFRDPQLGAYRSVQEYHRGDEVRPLAFPNIALRVSDLFASAE